MKVLSLFDGMSCGQIAFDKLGIKFDGVNNKYFASEIKDDGIMVCMDNYPNTIHVGDVTKVHFKDGTLYTENGEYKVGAIDYLIGGSPCQDFSQANRVRSGVGGSKSGLLFEYLRILEEVKPTYYLLENVRMKPEHRVVVNKLIGSTPININSKLVSAQLRDRYYWTNIKGIDQPEDKGILLQDILLSGYTDKVKSRALLESDSRPLATPVKMYHRYHKFNTLIFKDEEHYIKCRQHYNENYKGLAAKEIVYNGDVYDGVRYLNQTELELLQTVPKGYTKLLSRDKAAGVLGDGWTVDVIAHILKYTLKEDEKESDSYQYIEQCDEYENQLYL